MLFKTPRQLARELPAKPEVREGDGVSAFPYLYQLLDPPHKWASVSVFCQPFRKRLLQVEAWLKAVVEADLDGKNFAIDGILAGVPTPITDWYRAPAEDDAIWTADNWNEAFKDWIFAECLRWTRTGYKDFMGFEIRVGDVLQFKTDREDDERTGVVRRKCDFVFVEELDFGILRRGITPIENIPKGLRMILLEQQAKDYWQEQFGEEPPAYFYKREVTIFGE